MTPEEVAGVLADHEGHHGSFVGRCCVCDPVAQHHHPVQPCLPYRLAEQITAAWDEGEAAGRENEQDLMQSVGFQEPWTNPYRVWTKQS